MMGKFPVCLIFAASDNIVNKCLFPMSMSVYTGNKVEFLAVNNELLAIISVLD